MEVLENIQRDILTHLKDIPETQSFFLTGGTALSAFYLFHRKSLDLDFFTSEEELIQTFSHKIEEALRQKGFGVERRRGFRSFVELVVGLSAESTIIHLALDSPFRLEPVREAEDFPGIKIDSLPDIAANKLLALFGRAALRDFIDVYFLVIEKLEKDELIHKAKMKDPGFDLYWLGTSLERIHEFSPDTPEMFLLVKPCPWEDLLQFFGNWREEIYLEISRG